MNYSGFKTCATRTACGGTRTDVFESRNTNHSTLQYLLPNRIVFVLFLRRCSTHVLGTRTAARIHSGKIGVLNKIKTGKVLTIINYRWIVKLWYFVICTIHRNDTNYFIRTINWQIDNYRLLQVKIIVIRMNAFVYYIYFTLYSNYLYLNKNHLSFIV